MENRMVTIQLGVHVADRMDGESLRDFNARVKETAEKRVREAIAVDNRLELLSVTVR